MDKSRLFGAVSACFLLLGYLPVCNADILNGLVAYYPFNGNALDSSPTFATQHWKKLNPLFSLTSGPQGLHYKRPVISSYLRSTESSVVAVAAVPS